MNKNEATSPKKIMSRPFAVKQLSEVLIISSFPPRECGIATYSQDLLKALDNKFDSFTWKVCALQAGKLKYDYPAEVEYVLDTLQINEFGKVAHAINKNQAIKMILIQHEFGFFASQEDAFQSFVDKLDKPVITAFHTVLPSPDDALKLKVKNVADASQSILVMTHHSEAILIKDYGIPKHKIAVIAHGTHLVPHLSKTLLKEKYNLQDRKILATFGLLSSGKSIETTLYALPEIVKEIPDVLFLIIGKTHPGVIKSEGEKYRLMLEDLVASLGLKEYVKFVNYYVPLSDLLEYLQLTDIYLFTSKDPNQAVSGTFSYAMSCACPIISTPIPHALEVLTNDTGVIIDFRNSQQLATAAVRLLGNEELRNAISLNTLQKIVFTAWENSAVAHALLFDRISKSEIALEFKLPIVKLDHIRALTTEKGMVQFSKINQPDLSSGYTLDDNARALIAVCMHYESTRDRADLILVERYLDFIRVCLQEDGRFLNYVDEEGNFTSQNQTVNLEDSNGRAIWALGYLVSKGNVFPSQLVLSAKEIINKCLLSAERMHSTRAMAFVIKGLCYYHQREPSRRVFMLVVLLATRLSNMYKHESESNWKWYESYLTYGNSILPEAMLYAYLLTNNTSYGDIARESFDFLLSQTYNEQGIKVISNKSWLQKGEISERFGEQPIDIAYTVIALDKFYETFHDEFYLQKMKIAFDWFSGRNHLNQIIYNPCTGGCYDGLEETQVNINQGAESTVSYLMARMTIEKNMKNSTVPKGEMLIEK